jgi:hypothetical protein
MYYVLDITFCDMGCEPVIVSCGAMPLQEATDMLKSLVATDDGGVYTVRNAEMMEDFTPSTKR